MKTRIPWTLAMLLVLGAPAAAQPIEVPLEFTRRPERPPYRFLPMGLVQLEKRLEAPAGFKLPRLVSPVPIFAFVQLGDGKRLLVLDKPSAEHPFYDRLYLDLNGNLDLTDDRPVIGVSHAGREQYNRTRRTWYFYSTFTPPAVQVISKGRSHAHAFRFTAYFSSRPGAHGPDDPPADREIADGLRLNLMTDGAYTGRFELDGQTYHVIFGDNDANGCFGDPANPNDSSRRRYDRLYLSSSEKVTYYDGFEVGNLLSLQGRLYGVTACTAEKRLRLVPRNTGLGCLHLPMDTERLTLVSEDNVHRVMAYRPGRSIRVPPGRYRVGAYQARRDDDGGNAWSLRATGAPGGPVAEVKADGEATLAFGEPFVPTVRMRKLPDGKTSLALEVRGAAGERLAGLGCSGRAPSRIERSTKKPAFPKEATYKILAPDGAVAASGVFKYG